MLGISKMEIPVLSVPEMKSNHKQEMQRVAKVVEVHRWQIPNAQPVVNSFTYSNNTDYKDRDKLESLKMDITVLSAL